MIRTDAAHPAPQPAAPTTREETFAAALPWVRYHAERIARRLPASSEFDADDLFQVGAIAAWDLTTTWDAGRSLFHTYAWKRVVGVMIDLVRDASACGFAVAGSRAKMRRGEPIRVDSLSRVVHQGSGSGSGEVMTLADMVGECDEDNGDGAEAEFAALLRRIEADVVGQERDMMLRVFARGESQKRVSQDVGLSESRVSQVVGAVVARIRDRCEALGLSRHTAFA